MAEIKNGRLGLYCTEYLKCNRMMTLGFKGLSKSTYKVHNQQKVTMHRGLY